MVLGTAGVGLVSTRSRSALRVWTAVTRTSSGLPGWVIVGGSLLLDILSRMAWWMDRTLPTFPGDEIVYLFKARNIAE